MRFARTRALLLAVTDSGLLTVKAMQKLRTDLERHVGPVNDDPETALLETAKVWNELDETRQRLLGDHPSPGVDQHPRPKIFPPR